MLLISSTIKSVFKRVFILMMVIQIILLVSIILVYRSNSQNLSKDIDTNTKMLQINYRDLFTQYIKEKYDLQLGDLILIQQTYDVITEWRKSGKYLDKFSQYSNDLIGKKCGTFGGDVQRLSSLNSHWHNDNSTSAINTRMIFTWYNGNREKDYSSLALNDKEGLVNLCVLNSVLKELLIKHLDWRSVIPVSVNYYTFTFSNSLFVKFPLYSNSYMYDDWINTSRNISCFTTRTEYDPKCRPFYTETVNDKSNIVIVKPYITASTQQFGTDMCIKSIAIDSKLNIPQLITCVNINFDDFQQYRSDISKTLNPGKNMYLIYRTGDDISIMLSTQYSPKEYKSWGNNLNINKNDDNNLFEIYSLPSFNEFNKSTGILTNEIDLIKNYYYSAFDFYNSKIKPNISKIIDLYENDLHDKITVTNFTSYNDTRFFFTIEDVYGYNKKHNKIETLLGSREQFYIFPLPMSFSYNTTYSLSQGYKPQFYLLTIDRTTEKYANVLTFMNVVCLEILLFFFFLVGSNCFIWVLFAMVYYYFSKGFFKPLHKINELLQDSLLNYNSADCAPGDNGALGKVNSSKKNIFEKFLLKWIHKIFQLDEYQELKACMKTLTMIKILREFNSTTTKEHKLNYNLHTKDNVMVTIMDALFYLMQDISVSTAEDINIDFDLLVDLVDVNFVYVINSYRNEYDVEDFYRHFNSIIDVSLNKKHINSRASTRLKIHLNKGETMNNLPDIESDELDNNTGNNVDNNAGNMNQNNAAVNSAGNYGGIVPGNSNANANYNKNDIFSIYLEIREKYTKMKESLQYRYCIFKMNKLEIKFELYEKEILDYDYNSDDENEVLANQDHDKDPIDDLNSNCHHNQTLDSNNQSQMFHHDYVDQEFNKKSNTNSRYYNEDEEFFINKNEENTIKKSKIKASQDDILFLVNEFDRYFSMTHENLEISFELLKHVAAHITQSKLLFEIDRQFDGIRQLILAMELIKKLHIKLDDHGRLAKFAFLNVSILLFTKILYLISTLSEKYDQKKTQFYIYLNILDLGPVYDRKIRKIILQKLLDHLNKSGLDTLKNPKYLKYSDYFDLEPGFVETKLVRHKVRALLNMTKVYTKNILLLSDLNLNFLKEINFHNILKKNKGHFYYLSSFDQNLYIYRSKVEEENQNYILDDNTITGKCLHKYIRENQEILNLYTPTSAKAENLNTHTDDFQDYNSYQEYFDFLINYSRNIFTENMKPRLDISIKNAIHFHKFVEFPKNNNFIVVLTNIDSGFSFERNNLIELSKILYENQYSLILCILCEPKLYNNEKYKNKLFCYKKFIESDIINGNLFLLKNFTMLKYIVNCINPTKFKEFDVDTMNTLLEAVDLNFCEGNDENMFASNDEDNRFRVRTKETISRLYSEDD